MGTVWRATDTLLHRDVAVKEVVLPPGLAASDRDAMYERTLREARAAAALSHPAVVQVYDVVTEAGRPWIVMEILEARSLADHVIEDGPVAPRPVAKIGIALLGALEVAHAAGVLHRDVKPANVLICADGRCVLTDFGVARMPTDMQLTTPGMVLGSPHFISPERAMGGTFGPPSDLFSLGVTLYTAVEGRPPFDKGDPIETMHAVVEDPPVPPIRAGALADVLYGLLEKDPARRWDVATARGRLRELLAGPLASTAPPHLATDPYAVVPAQRAARHAGPDPTRGHAAGYADPPATPTGQIGGRAMLAPNESITGRLRQQQADGAQPLGRAPDQTDPGLRLDHADPGARGWDDPTGQGWPPPGGRPGAVGGAITGVRRAGATAFGTVRAWPRRLKVLAAAGLVAAVLLVPVLVANLGDEPSPSANAGPSGEPSASPSAQAFPVQAYSERGVSVNVPAGWRKATARSYVDFVDPTDSDRRIRILVESSKAEPTRFMEVAENRLKRSDNCKPYTQIAFGEEELALQPAAELEYTCGSRHGVWRATVVDGKAYSFYLSTREDQFEDSRAIFDEMVRSFQLTPAG
jgi:hypothetical protein